MIYRTFICLNVRCKFENTSTDDHPPCPRCGGMRVKWLPKPFGIGGSASQIDRTVRELADQAGLTNFNSPVAGQPVIQARPTGQPAGNLPFQPNPGWKVDLPAQCLQGQGQAYCAPTGVTARLRNTDYQFAEKVVPASKSLGAGTQIEGSYRPPGGIPKE